MEAMVKAAWVGKTIQKPLFAAFVSPSFYGSHYKPNFENINKFPQMLLWLKGSDDAPDDLETWGLKKPTYTFADLTCFIKNQGTINPDEIMKKSYKFKSKSKDTDIKEKKEKKGNQR
ncbi:hypothetical protein BDQ12DRAFT_730015 [Crucibulum laeve]|uniref:Uncharacterized protein n=1 Tax=Crucibulum laeve TaxID=68775 RepID=A0A5C3LD91_9AGAR|nr:hypothetical protein BDQ12DRAFT_730015 [Crucibulum laeve]